MCNGYSLLHMMTFYLKLTLIFDNIYGKYYMFHTSDVADIVYRYISKTIPVIKKYLTRNET